MFFTVFRLFNWFRVWPNFNFNGLLFNKGNFLYVAAVVVFYAHNGHLFFYATPVVPGVTVVGLRASHGYSMGRGVLRW